MRKRAEIRKLAQSFIGKYEIKVPPVNIFDIVTNEGLGVKALLPGENTIDGDEVEGQLQYDAATDMWTISFNALSSETRQRFTVAHEFGHYVLHKKPIVDRAKVFQRKVQWDITELEANVFAAEILMPRDIVLSQGKKVVEKVETPDGFISSMAGDFKVSMQAMRYHLKNIGVLKE